MSMLDTFAGGGGWEVAARELGWTDIDRVENWGPANATAAAAGFGEPVALDVRDYHTAPGRHDLQTHSPSCKRFSPAGNGAGRRQLDVILLGVRSIGNGYPIHRAHGIDPDAALTLEPLRLILEGMPRAVACEQAASVLPIWEAYADVMRTRRYSVWTGVVDAADFGVPQNRKRAVLLARNDLADKHMIGPLGTYVGLPMTLGETLGWTNGTHMVSNYGTGGDPKNRGVRYADQPSFAITGRADRNKVHFPDGSVRNLTLEEAAKLQTFPDGYPFQGTKSERGQQVGNAVPPMLARALLRELLP